MAVPVIESRHDTVDVAVSVETQLVARRVAVRVVKAMEAAGARVVLVTSAFVGEGKTRFLKLIGPELNYVAPSRFFIVGAGDLTMISPTQVPEDRIILVDGPAMMEGEGILKISPEWMKTFDAAIVLVMGRSTDREGLAEMVAWLRANGIPPLGIVFNQLASPTVSQRLKRLGRSAGKLLGVIRRRKSSP